MGRHVDVLFDSLGRIGRESKELRVGHVGEHNVFRVN